MVTSWSGKLLLHRVFFVNICSRLWIPYTCVTCARTTNNGHHCNAYKTSTNMPKFVLVEYSPFKNSSLSFSAASSSEKFSKACFYFHMLCSTMANMLSGYRLKSGQLNDPNILYYHVGEKVLVDLQTPAHFWVSTYRLDFVLSKNLTPLPFHFIFQQCRCPLLKMCGNHTWYSQVVDHFCWRSYAIYYKIYKKNIWWCYI